MALGQLVGPKHRHPRMRTAQPLAPVLRLRLPFQHGPLRPHGVQLSLLPVERDDVPPGHAPLAPVPVARVRLVAERVGPVQALVVVERPARTPLPVRAVHPVVVAVAGREARRGGVLVRQA